MANIEIKGVLEIDYARGVMYFHDGATGWTVVRISKLPPIPKPDLDSFGRGLSLLDITHMQGTSWDKKDG